MKFKTLTTFGLFLLAVQVHQSYCVTNILPAAIRVNLENGLPRKNESGSNDWKRGVKECYAGCLDVLESFEGPFYRTGDTVVRSFKTHTDYLGVFTNCNSTIISMGSTDSLKAISGLNRLGKSIDNLLIEFDTALTKMSSAYRSIIGNLSPSLGRLVKEVNENLSATENSLHQVLQQFENRFEKRRQKLSEKIAIEELMRNTQMWPNTLAVIAETALHECGCFTYSNDVFDAITVAILVYNHYLISIQGISANIGSQLMSESRGISLFHEACLQAFEPLLVAIAHSIPLITSDTNKSLRDFLTTFVEETHSLNERLIKLMGKFEGCNITVEHIKKNLAKSQS